MSDPAFKTVSVPDNAIPFWNVPRSANAVYIFDFDGVVSTPTEDAIYKLPERNGEREFLSKLADKFKIPCQNMELGYQRHLLFQEAALRMELPIEFGPAFELVKWASVNARYFLLTARSGWGATQRVRDFVNEHLQPPIEIYQVGRTPKALQISLVCQEFSNTDVYYIEDSASHLQNAAEIVHKNLNLVYCEPSTTEEEIEALYKKVFSRGS